MKKSPKRLIVVYFFGMVRTEMLAMLWEKNNVMKQEADRELLIAELQNVSPAVQVKNKHFPSRIVIK